MRLPLASHWLAKFDKFPEKSFASDCAKFLIFTIAGGCPEAGLVSKRPDPAGPMTSCAKRVIAARRPEPAYERVAFDVSPSRQLSEARFRLHLLLLRLRVAPSDLGHVDESNMISMRSDHCKLRREMKKEGPCIWSLRMIIRQKLNQSSYCNYM